MKKALLSLFLLFVGLVVFVPTPSYARTHVYVDFNVWPHDYYLGYPYYYDWDDYYYYPPYYYPNYYYPNYYYPDYAVSTAAVAYQPVVINGMSYYLNNGTYYVYTPSGYQPVATPAGAPQPETVTTAQPTVTTSDDTITVNIPNHNGGYTPVVLKKSGRGFVGPQGEYYAEFPKVSQLETMYGK